MLYFSIHKCSICYTDDDTALSTQDKDIHFDTCVAYCNIDKDTAYYTHRYKCTH